MLAKFNRLFQSATEDKRDEFGSYRHCAFYPEAHLTPSASPSRALRSPHPTRPSRPVFAGMTIGQNGQPVLCQEPKSVLALQSSGRPRAWTPPSRAPTPQGLPRPGASVSQPTTPQSNPASPATEPSSRHLCL